MKANISRYFVWMVYAILWGMVWAYPVLVLSVRVLRDGGAFSCDGILHAWSNILPFFLIFLLHRIPVSHLLMRHKTRAYSLCVILLIALLAGWQYWNKEMNRPREPERHTMFAGEKAFVRKQKDAEADKPVMDKHHPGPPGVPGVWTVDLIIAILMLGFDLAIVLLLRYQQEQERERQLEASHLQHELEHLKAQISPHFFMNMLNNIHGMVELNPAQAQVMLMELSRLMRYVLYEGAKPYTTLQMEIEFITNYVELMRKRYSSRKVRIGLRLPDRIPERICIPPLLFISIVENAFKHGISYRNASFVEVGLQVGESTVCLECMNSVHRLSGQEKTAGGIGLVNLRQRLQLLYNKNFTMEIIDTETVYHVKLIIPFENETDKMSGSR